MSHTVQTSLYRDRQISSDITIIAEDWERTWSGSSCVIDSNGKKITPTISCLYHRWTDNDYGRNENHRGWVLLGDFIFLVEDNSFYLWVPSTDPDQGSKIRLCSNHDYSNFYGNVVSGIRFINYVEEHKEDQTFKRGNVEIHGSFDAIAGAARVFVDEHSWRWLFPHPEGVEAALKHLKETTPTDDLLRLKDLLPQATETEKTLFRNHFEVRAYNVNTDSMSYGHGKSVNRIPTDATADQSLLDLLAEIFPTDSFSYLDPIFTRISAREKKDPNSWYDGWENKEKVDLKDVLSGEAEAGPIGWNVTIGNAGATALDGLEKVDNIVEVKTDRFKRLTDISGLATLSKLERLDLFDSGALTDISVLQQIPSLKHLKLRVCSAIENFDALSSLTNLTHLDLYSSSFTDVTILSNLSNLQKLNLIYLDFPSLAPLRGLEKLTHVDFSRNKELESLTGLPKNYLESLTTIELSGLPKLQDISALKEAINLTKIKWSSSNFSLNSLNTLADLPSLKSLEINDISNFATSSDIPLMNSIEELSLQGSWRNNIQDLSALQHFPNLKKLTLRYVVDNIDLSPIKELSELEHLSLDCTIGSIDFVAASSKLKNLDISGSLQSLTGVERCTSLEILRLNCSFSGNHISLSPLAALTTLRELTIYKPVELQNINVLANLINLTRIELGAASNNSPVTLAALTPLQNLTNLEGINIGDSNRISSFQPLENLDKLKRLNLGQFSAIKDLQGIPNNFLTQVRSFTLNFPNLTNADLLQQATELQYLYLKNYPLSTVPPIGQLESLKSVQFNHASKLSDYSNLLPGKSITSVSIYEDAPLPDSLEPFVQLPNLNRLSTPAWSEAKLRQLEGYEQLVAKLGSGWNN